MSNLQNKHHRVFVAINPDEQTIAEIGELTKEFRKKLPLGIENKIRFMPPENWHITLSFLGHHDGAAIEKIKEVLKETAKQFGSQNVKLGKLFFAPRGRQARMIWLMGNEEASRKLGEVKKSFEDQLGAAGATFNPENRPFNMHITLARFDFVLQQDKPLIEKEINLQFEAATLDFMESELGRGGAKYTILQKFPFKALP